MDVTGKTKIYRKDFNGKPSYSRAISSQEYKDGVKGDWITVFEPVQFPKGTDIPDRAIVEIVKAFEATFKGKNGNQRKLVVQEFKVLFTDTAHQDEEYTELTDGDIPF